MKPSDQSPKKAEEKFKTINMRLLDFYESEDGGLSDKEKKSLQPILNSLQDGQSRYEEIELIAEGAEKRITRVFDRRLNRQVAMARAVKANTAEEQEQFLREAHIEANLSHPNILQVYNIGLDGDNIPFFTMELIPGDSLKHILDKLKESDPEYRQRYTLDHLLGIFLKICDAIAYAHSRNVLHLDLKPDNIKIGAYGEVFVCDWGLSIVMGTDDPSTLNAPGHLDGDMLNDMTLTGIIKGTPGFMAPEQTVADGQKTRQTDVYALGAILYQILTKNPPVVGESAHAVLDNTRKGKIIPPRHGLLNSKVPRSLSACAMKALALDPEKRYRDVKSLQKEIVRYLSGYPTQAEKAGPSTLLTLLLRRHSRTASQLLILLTLLITAISTTLIIIQKQKGAALTAKAEAESNFELYREQQETTRLLDEKLTETMRVATYNAGFTTYDMIQILEAGLKKDLSEADRNLMLIYKARLHFIHQQFNAAEKCFDQITYMNSGRAQHVAELTKEMAWIKPDDYKKLSNAELAWLLNDTPHHIKILHHLYHHHMQYQKEVDPEDYLPLAQAIMEHINKIPSPGTPWKLEKRPEGLHLDLSDRDYFTFTMSDVGYHLQNVIAPLKLHSLDISGISLIDPAEMRYFHVKELTMLNMNITRAGKLLYYLKEQKLDKLIYNPGDFPSYFATKLKEQNPNTEIIETRP